MGVINSFCNKYFIPTECKRHLMDDVYLWAAFLATFAIIIINDIVHWKDVKLDRIVYAPERTLRRYFFILMLGIIAMAITSFAVLGVAMLFICIVLGIITSIRIHRLMLKRKSNGISGDVLSR